MKKEIITTVVCAGFVVAGVMATKGFMTGGRGILAARASSAVPAKPTLVQDEWRIDSWENGVFSLSHDGVTYKATCAGSYVPLTAEERAELPPGADLVFKNGAEDLANCQSHMVDMVGRSVGRRDASGWTTTIGQSGDTLYIDRQRGQVMPDEHEAEDLKVISAKRAPGFLDLLGR